MKAICFKCHFVGVGVSSGRCPGCGFPLIVSTESSRLGMTEIEQVFEATDRRSMTAPLPGVVFKAPKPFLKKRVGSATKPVRAITGGGTSIAGVRPKQRVIGEVVAASAAFVGGLLITLAAFGAL